MILVFALLCVGCSSSTESSPAPDAGAAGATQAPATDEATQLIGNSGGSLEHVSGAKVTVPEGALKSDVLLGLDDVSTQVPAPEGMKAAGRAFALTPYDALFATAVNMRIPVSPGATVVGRLDGPNDTNWELVPGATGGDGGYLEVPAHKGGIFAGLAAEPDFESKWGTKCNFNEALGNNDPHVLNTDNPEKGLPGCTGNWVCSFNGALGTYGKFKGNAGIGFCRGAGEIYTLCTEDTHCNTGLDCFLNPVPLEDGTKTGYCFDSTIPIACDFAGAKLPQNNDPRAFQACNAENWACGRNGQCQTKTSSKPGTFCIFDKSSELGDLWSQCGDGEVCSVGNVCVSDGTGRGEIGSFCTEDAECDGKWPAPLK